MSENSSELCDSVYGSKMRLEKRRFKVMGWKPKPLLMILGFYSMMMALQEAILQPSRISLIRTRTLNSAPKWSYIRPIRSCVDYTSQNPPSKPCSGVDSGTYNLKTAASLNHIPPLASKEARHIIRHWLKSCCASDAEGVNFGWQIASS